MSRITEILLRARDTLADPNGERWSDARLIRLIDEGQTDLAKQTRLLKGETDLEMFDGQSVYDLPSDSWLITRAAFDKCQIPLHTHHELDELVRTRVVNQEELYFTRRGTHTKDFSFANYCWELEESTEVEALIYDRRNMDEIKVFPIPLGTVDNIASAFGVVTSYDDFTLSSLFGVVVDIQEDTEFYDFDSTSGVTTLLSISTGDVHLWYIRLPTKVTVATDKLEMPTIWDVALKHYVIAHAFDDDYDTKFDKKSAKALALYERELELGRKIDSLDAVRANQYRSDYRGAFES